MVKLQKKKITAKLYEEQAVVICKHTQITFPLKTQTLIVNCYECKINFEVTAIDKSEKAKQYSEGYKFHGICPCCHNCKNNINSVTGCCYECDNSD